MAIKKKLIHFETFSNFNSKKLSANKENTQYTVGVDGAITTGNPDILYQSICYIKDHKKIWTHATLYDCNDADKATIATLHLDHSGVLSASEYAEYSKIYNSKGILVVDGAIDFIAFNHLYMGPTVMASQGFGIGGSSYTLYVYPDNFQYEIFEQKFIDATISDDSTNPVQNKVIKEYVDTSIEDSFKYISVTFDEFVLLYDNLELEAGRLYRITDYETVYEGGSVAGHHFDLLVLATGPNSYSNKCWAMDNPERNNSYFDLSDLSKWQIWWTHQVDETPYIGWVPTTGHKGCIYRMIDEWGNDCPYDFKNILLYHPNRAYTNLGSLGDNGSLPDEVYTFTVIADGVMYDASLYLNNYEIGQYGCVNNVIKGCTASGLNGEAGSEYYIALPFNSFVVVIPNSIDSIFSSADRRICDNFIDENSTSVQFFAECNYFNISSNKIGRNSDDLTIWGMQDDIENTAVIKGVNIGNNSHSIILQASIIEDITIGNNCQRINFACQDNTRQMPIIYELYGINIGNNCSGLTAGEIGTQEMALMYNITIGNDTDTVKFSWMGRNVEFYDYKIGGSCHDITIDVAGVETISIGNNCTTLKIGAPVGSIGDGCYNIDYMYGENSLLSFAPGVQNLQLRSVGVNGTVIMGGNQATGPIQVDIEDQSGLPCIIFFYSDGSPFIFRNDDMGDAMEKIQYEVVTPYYFSTDIQEIIDLIYQNPEEKYYLTESSYNYLNSAVQSRNKKIYVMYSGYYFPATDFIENGYIYLNIFYSENILISVTVNTDRSVNVIVKDLSNYATTEYVNSQIGNINTVLENIIGG